MVRFIEGNLFDSKADVICHQCNCQGVMGSGVAAEVKKRYPEAFNSYRKDYENGKLELGYVNFADINATQTIANMCAQDNYGYNGVLYTDYDALKTCFRQVTLYAFMKYAFMETGDFHKPTIALPYKLGCCRGGGDWNVVYKIIEDTFNGFNVEIWRLSND